MKTIKELSVITQRLRFIARTKEMKDEDEARLWEAIVTIQTIINKMREDESSSKN